MRKYLWGAALALTLAGGVSAFAADTPSPASPNYNSVALLGDVGSETTKSIEATVQPSADVHDDNKRDYRLTCPTVDASDPSVEGCRKLYDLKDSKF